MSQICNEIHKIFKELPRHSFPFNKTTIPKNGIYIIFEKNEYAHGADRIVRIGTHTGEKQLFSRLQQHFVKENKDRSIFRKNIGRALLNKENDPFLEQWDWDLTTKEKKEKYLPLLNQAKQKEVENRVSEYIQTNLSFCVIHVEGKEKRLELESKIISTVSLCEDCKPSKNWLGNFSPKRKIRESGLWLVNELYKDPLKFTDWKFLEIING
jgi:hypothetical protein